MNNDNKEKRLYIVRNLINGKVYGGKHYWNPDTKYMGSGYALKKAFEKYGKENFSIRWLRLKIKSSEDLDRFEIRMIRLLKHIFGNRCYNIQKGGCGGYFTYYMTDEQKQEVFEKISEGKRKQYASGLTKEQLEGRKKANERKKYRLENEDGYYEKVYIEGNRKRLNALKLRKREQGLSNKEKNRNAFLPKYSLVLITYKLKYSDGNEIIETNTLKDFQEKYNTQDMVFSHIKKHGFLKFLQKKNVSKHVFPTGTELHYISECRWVDMYKNEETGGSSAPPVSD